MKNIKSTDKASAGMCESCMMPFKKDPKGQNRESKTYCSYCFCGGKLCYSGDDVKEFKKAMIESMVSRGETKLKAKFFALMAGFAPRWKNNKR